jgi:hypothetical protein
VAHRLGNSKLLVESVESFINAAARAGRRTGGYAFDIYLSATSDLEPKARDLAVALEAKGYRVMVAESRAESEGTPAEDSDRALDKAQHAVFLVGREASRRVDGEMRRFARQLLDEQSERLVLPICFFPGQTQPLPSLFLRSQIVVEPDVPVMELAERIERELRLVRPDVRSTSPPVVLPEIRLARSKLGSPNPLARKAAVATLGRIGDKANIEELVNSLNDSSKQVQDEAKRSIIEVYKRQKNSHPDISLDLQPLLTSDVPAVRSAAAEILATMGDDKGVYVLLELLDDPDASIRARAADNLGMLRNPIALDWLLAHFDDSEGRVRRSVLVALLRMGQQVVPAVLDLYRQSDNYWNRDLIVQILASAAADDSSLLTPLFDRFDDPDLEYLFASILRFTKGGSEVFTKSASINLNTRRL